MPKLEFWYDFASTYSYLSAIRIEAMAKPAQVEIIYRPFLLGPIFKSYGWNTSPFRLFPVKGNHMVRDITRIAGDRGSAFHMPEVFPANSLQAARMALVAEEQGCIGSFTRLVFEAEFSECRDPRYSPASLESSASMQLAAPIPRSRTACERRRSALLPSASLARPRSSPSRGELVLG